MGTHQRRTQKLENFYGTRTMTLGTMIDLVGRVLNACRLHLDPATLARLTAEVDEIKDG